MIAVVVIGVVAGIAVIAGLLNRGEQAPRGNGFYIPELKVKARASIPFPTRAPTTNVAQWSQKVSARTDVPARALVAYARAERMARARTPGCRVSWATIAGLGEIESQHGQHDGATLQSDGTPSVPIIGPRLDGSTGVRAVRDTDDGKLDGDKQWDRAVGPMQFLPQTWQQWGVRATGDGRAPDPQSIDDAAATSARYLCLNGRHIGTPTGWWNGVLIYNNSLQYGRDVYSAADAYARTAKKATAK